MSKEVYVCKFTRKPLLLELGGTYTPNHNSRTKVSPLSLLNMTIKSQQDVNIRVAFEHIDVMLVHLPPAQHCRTHSAKPSAVPAASGEALPLFSGACPAAQWHEICLQRKICKTMRQGQTTDNHLHHAIWGRCLWQGFFVTAKLDIKC